jgi:hypothetical protein
MPTLHDCLQLIESARASAREPESAYVLRTRLKRSLLGASQLAATYAGAVPPLMPDDINHLVLRDPVSSDVLRNCLRLLANSRSLCQPSEALDDRWRSGWDTVCKDLDRLERALLTLGGCGRESGASLPAAESLTKDLSDARQGAEEPRG